MATGESANGLCPEGVRMGKPSHPASPVRADDLQPTKTASKLVDMALGARPQMQRPRSHFDHLSRPRSKPLAIAALVVAVTPLRHEKPFGSPCCGRWLVPDGRVGLGAHGVRRNADRLDGGAHAAQGCGGEKPRLANTIDGEAHGQHETATDGFVVVARGGGDHGKDQSDDKPCAWCPAS